MYAKCRTIEEACHLFHRMLESDSISWDSITRYVENGYNKEIL
jgi:pentatricopeptide repeat protein